MSVLTVKMILGVMIIAGGGLASALMLNLMGRPEHKTGPEKLKRAHRAAGIAFIVLLLANTVLGVRLLAAQGDAAPVRIWLKVVLGLALVLLLALKIVLVRFYKGFLRNVPSLGLTVLVLAILVFLLSGGFALVGGTDTESRGSGGTAPLSNELSGDLAHGAALFKAACAGCHGAGQAAAGSAGPGLKGLLRRPALPSSGRPATEENVRRQLRTPWKSMPSFARLEDGDVSDLLAYLRTL